MGKLKIPKDLGIKIGTPSEAFWTTVKNQAETDIITGKNDILLRTEILLVAKRKISEEQRRAKV